MPPILLDDAVADRVHALGVDIFAELAAAAAQFHPGAGGKQLGTGYALFAGEGSPITQLYGYAHRVPGDLAEIREFYAKRCPTYEVAVTPFTHAGLLRELLDAGFRPGAFEGELAQWVGDVPEPELRVEEVDGDDPAWIETTMRAWTEDGASPPRSDLPLQIDPLVHIIGATPTRKYVGFVDGRPAATSLMWDRRDGVVLASGAARTDARGRGLQLAMLHKRLRDAGPGRFAIVGAMPGTVSYRNVMRAGFTPLYSTLGLKPS
ncbi:MAG: hypothetical protein ABI678_27995 [Kofleriaceae bacterium]